MSGALLRRPAGLRALGGMALGAWMLAAAFPLVWVAAMSFKLPVDAFAADPLAVLLGPVTRAADGGLSLADLLAACIVVLAAAMTVAHVLGRGPSRRAVAAAVLAAAVVIVALRVLPDTGALGRPLIGFTWQAYRSVWIEHEFWRNFLNSLIVTTGVVTLSLTVGTLAGFALARSRTNLAYWLLITALIFRALPPSVLVAGYLPAFIASRDWLMPLWHAPLLGEALRAISPMPPTLYGKPWAAIGALVAINQPFTIWMLRSFFAGIPVELDEAAQIDGCTYGQAFRKVIMPVMWPGVITTGLFSFLLAYNDYLVCAMLLDAQNQTMVPAITGFFNRETTTTDEVQAVAAAVSITAPLFLLVLGFQQQIVSGLTAGAVKG
jgi:multiple sugar transport system permease protein